MESYLFFSVTVSRVVLVVKRPASARDLRDVSLNPGSGRSPGGGGWVGDEDRKPDTVIKLRAWPSAVHGAGHAPLGLQSPERSRPVARTSDRGRAWRCVCVSVQRALGCAAELSPRGQPAGGREGARVEAAETPRGLGDGGGAGAPPQVRLRRV